MSSQSGSSRRRRNRRGDSSPVADSSEDREPVPMEDDEVDGSRRGGGGRGGRGAPSSPSSSHRRGSSASERESDEEEGEDLDPTANRDYRPIPALDVLDREDVDDRDFEDITYEERIAAEQDIRRREVRRARIEGRLPRAFAEEEEEDQEIAALTKRHRRDELAGDMDVDLIVEDLPEGVSLADYLDSNRVKQEIRSKFSNFLRRYADSDNNLVYRDRIKDMCNENKQSLEVGYVDLSSQEPELALWVTDLPSKMLPLFNEGAMDVVIQLYENYAKIHTEVFVRITGLPVLDLIRDLRQIHLNALVRVEGVVTRRTSVYPQLKIAMFDCLKCGSTLGPFQQSGATELKVSHCPHCESSGPFVVNQEKTLYRNYQRLTLQESPGSVPAGRLPRSKEVILLADLIDCARPGEEIGVTGIFTNNFESSLNTKNGFPVFATVIEANHVSKKAETFSSARLTNSEKEEILELAKDPAIASKLIASIAPSIWGHEDVKTAIALSLFGGQPKENRGGHRMRGDINVLLLGDPGTAKSQFLKYVEKTAHRAVFTTGKGATAVGLTASVHKDPMTREWTLEGGALVLADSGTCLIDEFDKMSDQDRTSIHEAMEQQSISVSKAGIVTTLHARCGVIAAANPRGGRYNTSLHFNENVDLTEPILSRFDVLVVVKDTVDPVADRRLADFVIASHVRSHPDPDIATVKALTTENTHEDTPVPQEVLKRYIRYAREHIRPRIHDVDLNKVTALYAELRRESQAGGGVPIAVRHLESIVRMSEAYARMHLREFVRDEDIDFAIRVMLESFIGSQKYAVQRSLRRSFNKYIVYKKDHNELLFFLLQTLVREEATFLRSRDALRFGSQDTIDVDIEELQSKAREVGINDINPFFESNLFKSSFRLDRKAGKITSINRLS